MGYQEGQDTPTAWRDGYVKQSKNGTTYVRSVVIKLSDLQKECGSEYVELSIFDNKDHHDRKRLAFRQGNPQYYKDPAQFQKNGQRNNGQAQSAPAPAAQTYGNAVRNEEFVP